MEKLFYQPLNYFLVGQKFGENKVCVNPNNEIKLCDGNNPPEGWRSLYGTHGHLGIDCYASHGTPIYCAQIGKVVFIDTNPRSGLDVRVESVIGGDRYLHIYEHLMGYEVKKGDEVRTGQLIGYADNTGWSSGDHLHFEVHKNGVPIDPLSVMAPIPATKILRINNKLFSIKQSVSVLADTLAEYLRR